MTSNIEAGLKSATHEAVSVIKLIAVYGILPIACVFLIVLLLFFVLGAARKKKTGEDFQDDVWKCVTVLVILALVGSFTVWGWTMAGVGTSGGVVNAMASMLLTRVW